MDCVISTGAPDTAPLVSDRTPLTKTTTASATDRATVEAFLAGELSWLGITDLIDEVLQRGSGPADGLEAILAADREARQRAHDVVHRRARL